MNKKIEIEVPEGKKAEWVNGVLALVDVKDNRPITERIKTFDDALKYLGCSDELVMEYNSCYVYSTKSTLAYMKLKIIAKALNECEIPYNKEGRAYYVWAYFYTEKEYDNLVEDEKKRAIKIDALGGAANSGANAGAFFVSAVIAFSIAFSRYSVRLAYKNKESAEYSAKQFRDLWIDFLLK